MIPQVNPYSYIFPNPRDASKEGLIAWGGDLNPNRILSAYRQGIFPWYNEDDPILWWSPDPRLVLFFEDIKISKSLSKSLKKYEVKFNTNFKAVIQKCREFRLSQGENTWILEEVIDRYVEIHQLGFAMSAETYYEGELVGGLYGIVMGGVFCGESMFSLKSDASKVALVRLCDKLQEEGYDFIDCQVPSNHLKSMGAREISRDTFLELLEESLDKTT
ncbi:MAG: leucyl/phenylalanyl-tRNA--protein transferase [Epsilonproteobacteria bacterium]|nr:leucyl/phenylalanyl-tRNA--protein transferase [Campylobacterota bacterium]